MNSSFFFRSTAKHETKKGLLEGVEKVSKTEKKKRRRKKKTFVMLPGFYSLNRLRRDGSEKHGRGKVGE